MMMINLKVGTTSLRAIALIFAVVLGFALPAGAGCSEDPEDCHVPSPALGFGGIELVAVGGALALLIARRRRS